MAEPEADRGDVDEAKKALDGFVVAGRYATGVLQLIEAPLHEVSQAIEGPVHSDALLARLPHWDHWLDISVAHAFSNAVSIVTLVGQQNRGFGQVVVHDEIEAEVVGGLAGRDVGSHR